MHRSTRVALCLALLVPRLASAQNAPRQTPGSDAPGVREPVNFDTLRVGGMRWRSIGPFRGGRAVAVAGVPSQPLTYYMGSTGGGVWRTDDGGSNWRNLSDGQFRVGSIGAIAVADDDPNVVYVGTGEFAVRGQSSSYGDGMWKSTDAGRTWARIGLERTQQIAKVIVHPKNNDIVWVAAMGTRWQPGADRGIYRTNDGGKSWKLLLHPSDSAQAVDLSIDPTNPRVLYAAFWHHQRTPWQVRSGGTTGGIWKSTDGGDSWTKLGGGIPNFVGKIGVAVSPANPDRVYAVVEADSGGVFRSDDAGKTFRRVNEDRLLRARAWYYTNIIADPNNADVVYVLNAPITKSIDGGRTFAPLRALHGDNHALWINPRDSRVMINGNDGGASITFNGGTTWSTQDNQPTAQIYRVNTDAMFPYTVYGAQQDNSTLAIASRSPNGAIDRTDWFTLGGCESAHVAFDPAHPRYLYAGCYQGMIDEYDRDTKTTRSIMPWFGLGLAQPSNELKYRFNWSAPIATSPHDRNVIYHGGNVLFRTSDRGQSWTQISPDLTRNDKATQGWGGTPITNESAGGEVYGTIYYVAESPLEAGTIWTGSDDGLVHVTRDGGKTWTNVTPKGMAIGQVNAIELSPHDKGTAWFTLFRAKWADNAPYIYKTTDYGKTWTRADAGIRGDEVVRVVREDPVRRGMLFAGTESGAYLSTDGGTSWKRFQRNLPPVPVTDMQFRNGDLVASTEGRAFWILDDVTPLEQQADTINASAFLYRPRDVVRTSFGSFNAPGVGQNPPDGAIINLWLADAPDSNGVKVEIVGADGAVIRTLSSKRVPGALDQPLSVAKGLNRFTWDLRSESIARLQGLFSFGNPEGYRVNPGSYTVRVSAAGKSLTQPLRVLGDPRIQVTEADQRARQQLVAAVQARLNEIYKSTTQLRAARTQSRSLADRAASVPNSDSLRALAKSVAARADTLEERLVQPKTTNSQDILNYRLSFTEQLFFLANAIDGSETAPTQSMRERAEVLDGEWGQYKLQVDQVVVRDVARLNEMAVKLGVPAVAVPGPALVQKPIP